MIWYQRMLGSNRTQRATHWPRVHGRAALAGALLTAIESEISIKLWAKVAREGLHYLSDCKKCKRSSAIIEMDGTYKH